MANDDDNIEDVCGSLLEVIETEQVVEMLEDAQFLDLATSALETRSGTIAGVAETPEEDPSTKLDTNGHHCVQLAGQKRKRVEVDEGIGVFGGLSLPTAIVPPSPRTNSDPLPSQPKQLPTNSTHQLTSDPATVATAAETTLSLQSSLSGNSAVSIQLTPDEVQALFGIIRQRNTISSSVAPQPQSSSSSLSSPSSLSTSLHSSTSTVCERPAQVSASRSVVTAVVVPSPAVSSSSSLSSEILEAQKVAAAKASVKGKNRQCSCRNSECLKLYCECFSHEEWCGIDCSCRNCRNNSAFSQIRQLTLMRYKGRDPKIFHHGHDSGTRRGCKCRKTFCLKKYCECFHAGIQCTTSCQCVGCKNSSLSSSSSSFSSSTTTSITTTESTISSSSSSSSTFTSTSSSSTSVSNSSHSTNTIDSIATQTTTVSSSPQSSTMSQSQFPISPT